jgi:pimeloyl-ACP methyl ester carboxylesterase
MRLGLIKLCRKQVVNSREVQVAADLALAVYQDPLDWSVHTEGDTVWIAIEGSDELADWRRNFEFFMTSTDEHLGFGSYARELMAQMWASGVVLDPAKKTILCGHSLGGAVATIMATELQNHLPLLELVTFGSPRPGGKRLGKRLKVPHHRYVHRDDIVPHMPSNLLGFRHTTHAVMLEAWDGNLRRGISDHDMGAYRRLITDCRGCGGRWEQAAPG